LAAINGSALSMFSKSIKKTCTLLLGSLIPMLTAGKETPEDPASQEPWPEG
jgi:hypothetical protein